MPKAGTELMAGRWRTKGGAHSLSLDLSSRITPSGCWVKGRTPGKEIEETEFELEE